MDDDVFETVEVRAAHSPLRATAPIADPAGLVAHTFQTTLGPIVRPSLYVYATDGGHPSAVKNVDFGTGPKRSRQDKRVVATPRADSSGARRLPAVDRSEDETDEPRT